MIGEKVKSPEMRVDAAGVSMLLAIGAACWAINVRPFMQRHERTAILREDGERARESLEKAEQDLRKIEAQLRDVTNQASARPLVLEYVGRINQRMTMLSELARSPVSALMITETSAGEAQRGPRYMSVPIKLAGTGSFVGVRAWLERLASEQRDIGVKGLRLSGNDKGEANFAVDLVWYATSENVNGRAGDTGGAGVKVGSAEK